MEALTLHDYDFTYSKTCDCLSSTQPVRIQVGGDTVTMVTDLASTDVTGAPGMA